MSKALGDQLQLVAISAVICHRVDVLFSAESVEILSLPIGRTDPRNALPLLIVHPNNIKLPSSKSENILSEKLNLSV
jgi:hypothetical protein